MHSSSRGWQTTGCTVILLYIFVVVLHIIGLVVSLTTPVSDCHDEKNDLVTLQVWLLLTSTIGLVIWTIKVLAVLWCRHVLWLLFYRLFFLVNLVYQLLWISVCIALLEEGQVECLKRGEGAAVMTMIMLIWEIGTFVLNVLSRGIKPTVTQWMVLE